MGITNTGATAALWRFDSGVTVSDGGCAAKLDTRLYTYSDPNSSSPMLLGQCVYNTVAGCGATTSSVTAQGWLPLGLAACPASAPAVGAVSIFPAGNPGVAGNDYFGYGVTYPAAGSNGAALFDGSTQFGSVTAPGGDYNNTLNDLPATYTLSAWIKTSAAGKQRILSETGPLGSWGFGLKFIFMNIPWAVW